MGQFSEAEVRSGKGLTAGCRRETADYIYVFEFKLTAVPSKPLLVQIDDRGYLIPYTVDGGTHENRC